MKILVGVDGSESSSRAVAWCAKYASSLNAEVTALHAIERPAYKSKAGYITPHHSDEERERLRRMVVDEWCEELVQANVPVRTVLTGNNPWTALKEEANSEDADLVVVGRRGVGGFSGKPARCASVVEPTNRRYPIYDPAGRVPNAAPPLHRTR